MPAGIYGLILGLTLDAAAEGRPRIKRSVSTKQGAKNHSYAPPSQVGTQVGP